MPTEYQRKYIKEYQQRPEVKKKRIIRQWKKRGLIHYDYDELYYYYLSTKYCENCGVELCSGSRAGNRRVLDHDHFTGEFRNVLCHCCNSIRK
jgi:hypothetical protein